MCAGGPLLFLKDLRLRPVRWRSVLATGRPVRGAAIAAGITDAGRRGQGQKIPFRHSVLSRESLTLTLFVCFSS